MERSSPLAAMQPPSFPFGQWGCRADANSYSDCGGQYGGGKVAFGPSSFNFKDLSMSRAPSDYFSLKPVRGSSPTASLAADLSRNFHIDQRYSTSFYGITMMLTVGSPQLPTPRRSLFSTNLFASINGRGMMALLHGVGGRSRLNRKRDNPPTALVFTRSLQRVNGNIPLTP